MDPAAVSHAIQHADATTLALWALQIVGAAYSLWTTGRGVWGASRAAWRAGRNWRDGRVLARERRREEEERRQDERTEKIVLGVLAAYTAPEVSRHHGTTAAPTPVMGNCRPASCRGPAI